MANITMGKKGKLYLYEQGYSEQDVKEIEKCTRFIKCTINNNIENTIRKITNNNVKKLLSFEDYLTAIARCTFRCTAKKNVPNTNDYILFNLVID